MTIEEKLKKILDNENPIKSFKKFYKRYKYERSEEKYHKMFPEYTKKSVSEVVKKLKKEGYEIPTEKDVEHELIAKFRHGKGRGKLKKIM
jgi:hypothetical protein